MEELTYVTCPHLLSVQEITGLKVVIGYSLFLRVALGTLSEWPEALGMTPRFA